MVKKYSPEELQEIQQKVQNMNQEDIKNLPKEDLEKLEFLQCPFCLVLAGYKEGEKVYEDDKCTAMFEINPATPGHLVVVPNEHYQIAPQVPEDTMNHMGKVVKLLSHACLKHMGAKGTNVLMSNGPGAGQKLPHFAINIIPRNDKEELKVFDLPGKSADENSLNKLSSDLRKYVMKKLNITVSEDSGEEQGQEDSGGQSEKSSEQSGNGSEGESQQNNEQPKKESEGESQKSNTQGNDKSKKEEKADLDKVSKLFG